MNSPTTSDLHAELTAPRPARAASLLGGLGAALLWLLSRTWRWEYTGLPLDDVEKWRDEPVIIAFWHHKQLLMPWFYLKFRRTIGRRTLCVLISQHRDGRYIASAMRFLGISSVAGSSTRGGREAVFALIEALRGGSNIAITPDGPRGPKQKLKPGTIRIAQRSGARIIPMSALANRCWRFKSWDRMELPKPFSRAILVVGEPIAVSEDLSEEDFSAAMKTVEQALNNAESRASNYYDAAPRGHS